IVLSPALTFPEQYKARCRLFGGCKIEACASKGNETRREEKLGATENKKQLCLENHRGIPSNRMSTTTTLNATLATTSNAKTCAKAQAVNHSVRSALAVTLPENKTLPTGLWRGMSVPTTGQ